MNGAARAAVVTALVVVFATAASAGASGVEQVVAIEVPGPGITQEITLRDGTRAFGRVDAVDGTHVTFRTTDGAVLQVESDQILTLTVSTSRIVDGKVWKEDPNPTRLFFGPTGRSMGRGEVYLGVYEIYIPFVQVGVTDRFSMGAGTPLIFGGDTGSRPFWITPKVQVVDRGDTSAAIGVMHITSIDDGADVGVAYGVVTRGTRDSAVTFGGGYAYARGDSNGGAPVAMFGAEHRVHRSMKVVTENYVFEGGGIVSGGLRFMGERLTADLGLAAPLGLGETFVFPMVNFVWRFR